jgi:hypothetical protein
MDSEPHQSDVKPIIFNEQRGCIEMNPETNFSIELINQKMPKWDL